MSTTRLALIGCGRMGRALVKAASERGDLSVDAVVGSSSSAVLGRDAGELAGVARLGIPVTADASAAIAVADVVIDFSIPGATESHLQACCEQRKPLLLGTTGGGERGALYGEAAGRIPLLVAPNTSTGAAILTELVAQAALALRSGYDIEIVEAHHRMKRDAPSGTALALGRAAAEARGKRIEEVARVHADGILRAEEEIGFAVVRGGDLVGDHTVLFAGTGERLSLTHQVADRAVFARGALDAAVWLKSRPVGKYSMRDFILSKS